MFDKLKQISQLKKLQSQMKEEKVEVNEQGIKLIMNGNFEVEEIKLNQELNNSEQAQALKKCFNQAIREIQRKMAQNFSHLM